MKNEKELVRILRGAYLRTPNLQCKKVCSYCQKDIPKGMVCVALREQHRKGEGKILKKLFSTGSAFVHTECIENLWKEVKQAIEENDEMIKNNRKKVAAELL